MHMELLAPAGDREALVAAVQSGADAVYFGAKGFNARRGAENFAGDALREAIEYCHLRGVKVYITLNTLVRQDELKALEETILAIDAARADAVIVQDLGVAEAVRRLAPGLELHASTQMAVHNRQGVDYLAAHGFTRAVLAREMEYSEIRACKGRGVELEVFVHGALCVSCSGQCLFSSIVGGRSGNRGMCAQPCRLPYRLGSKEGYLLSTRDLMLLGELDKLAEAGADSLKIEGRLKRAEYVAATTAAYRKGLDMLAKNGGYAPAEIETEALRQMFNRGGFTRGYAPGLKDQELMYAARPNHLGVQVGDCRKNGFVRLDRDIDPQDALVLRRGDEDRPVKLSGRAGEQIACREAVKGDGLVRLVSEAQMQAARESVRGENRTTTLEAELRLRVGRPALLKLKAGNIEAAAEGELVQQAQNRPLDRDRTAAQLRKTGGTPYTIENIEFDADDMAYLPVSALNALRRDAIEAFSGLRLLGMEARLSGEATLTAPAPEPTERTRPGICAQSGDPSVLLRAQKAGAEALIFAPEDLRIPALDAALEMLGEERFCLALPQVVREKTLDAVNRWANDHAERIKGVYLANLGQFALKWPGRIVADAPMNIANTLALEEVKKAGAAAFTPSLELTASQISALGGERTLIVYGRLPLMQLRHCPLRATDKKINGLHADCRRCDSAAECDKINAQTLTDRKGIDFPLRRIASDEGCVIQVLNSVPLMLLRRAEKLPAACAWRLLLDKNDPVEALVRAHIACAEAGRESCRAEDWDQVDKMETTTGHYFRGVE